MAKYVLLDCGRPSVSSDGGVIIESFNDTLFNATIVFHCEVGLIPVTVIEAVCESTGVWNPNPANHMCVNQSSGIKSSLNEYVAPAVSCIVPTDAHGTSDLVISLLVFNYYYDNNIQFQLMCSQPAAN